MEKIKFKSGILVWSEDNINSTPQSFGVFMLRSSPINGDVIYVGSSINLREDLSTHFKENTFEDVKFFDWYVTDNKDDADLIKKEWDIKYNLINSNL